MKISDSFKVAINNTFKHTVFWKRDEETFLKTFNIKVKGSDNMAMLPPIDNVGIEKIDETHDKLTLIYDDYNVDGIVTWRIVNGHSVFVNFE